MVHWVVACNGVGKLKQRCKVKEYLRVNTAKV